jgi:hypothetical protein
VVNEEIKLLRENKMSKRDISFTRIELDKLSPKVQNQYKRKLKLFHFISKTNKRAPISTTFGDSASCTAIMAIRKEYFRGKAIVFNRVFGDIWGVNIYYLIVEERVEKPKELTINDTLYVYVIVKVDIGLKGYGVVEFQGELE